MEDSDSILIKRCIDISCVEKKDANNNIFSFGWTTSIASFKDKLIYNYFRLNSKFEMPRAKIHIYSKIYDNTNAKENQKINEKISKIIYVSYRSRYKPQTNSKNNKIYTSDCGWGCMIRSSQMILCRALYKIFKFIYKLDKSSIDHVIPFIMDKNLDII